MQLKLKISNRNEKAKNVLVAWIQRNKKFESVIHEVLIFFKDQIHISKIRKFFPYFKITSENPAIIISLFSTLLELIPELYFDEENNIELEEALNSI